MSPQHRQNPDTTKKTRRKSGSSAKRKRVEKISATTTERRLYLAQKLDDIGLWNISITEEAERFSVTRETIYRDLKVVTDEIDVVDRKPIMYELHRGYKKVMKEAWAGIHNKDLPDIVRTKWGLVLLKSMDSMTSFLEAYGMKKGNASMEIVRDMLIETGHPELLKELSKRFKALEAETAELEADHEKA